jgi:hypothetical protein
MQKQPPAGKNKEVRPCKPVNLQGRNLYTAVTLFSGWLLSQLSRMHRRGSSFTSFVFNENISVCISLTRVFSPK